MKKPAILAVLAVSTGLLASATAAGAATDLQKLKKRVAAYAARRTDGLEGFCTCPNGSSPYGRAGRLRYQLSTTSSGQRGITVWCQTELYDAQGDRLSTDVSLTFQPIGK